MTDYSSHRKKLNSGTRVSDPTSSRRGSLTTPLRVTLQQLPAATRTRFQARPPALSSFPELPRRLCCAPQSPRQAAPRRRSLALGHSGGSARVDLARFLHRRQRLQSQDAGECERHQAITARQGHDRERRAVVSNPTFTRLVPDPHRIPRAAGIPTPEGKLPLYFLLQHVRSGS